MVEGATTQVGLFLGLLVHRCKQVAGPVAQLLRFSFDNSNIHFVTFM
jgi:hypothetical protein